MLKQISTSDVELGMFIHKLNGNWFDHPFWRSRFLLEDAELLHRLQASKVRSVTIDTNKGYDLRPVAETFLAPPPVLTRNAARVASFNQVSPPTVQSPSHYRVQAREFGNARLVERRARHAVTSIFLEARLGKGIKARAVEGAVNDVLKSVQRSPHAFNGLMRCKRDNEYVYRHALAVCAMMIMLARRLKLPAQQVREAGMAGLLLDVGIGALPIDLTSYGGDYRNIPRDIFVSHVELGHSLLAISGDIPASVLLACLNHHEAMDGTGYPNSLHAKDIDLLSRMAAICDTYDALVSDTAEGVGMNPSSALQQLQMMTAWFDSEILRHFVEMLGLYPSGSVVKLRSGRLAMVYDQDPDAPELPLVRTFYHIEKDRLINGRNIALAQARGDDSIEFSADPEDYGINDFPGLREKIFNKAVKDAAARTSGSGR